MALALTRWVGRAIGLDVHRDFCVVAICEDGKVRSAGRVPSTPAGLRALAESRLSSDRVALEVTGSCWEVARILEPCVNRVIVVSPDDTGISSARAKTAKLDPRTLASLLWKGELDAVWMPDERCRILRRRLARREQLMRARTRSKNEIQAVLARRLQSKPPFADLFGVKGRQWLAGLELPVEERESSDAGLRHIAFMDTEIAAVDRLVAQQALSWPEIRRLMTVSGVNLICAASFLAAIGEPSRFLTSRKLVAYLGLDPKVRQSGEAPTRSGRISKRSSATARKLTVLFWCMLTRGEDYAHQRPALTRKKQRQLELTAGAPARTKQAAGIWSTNRAILHAERALAEQPRCPASGWSPTKRPEGHHEKWARARHRSAHKSGPRRA